MIDVGAKAETRRRAVATGAIRMARATLERVRARDVPKGDVLALAEVAGILAAKKTPELLPLCHPLALDAVQVRCETDLVSDTLGEVRIRCEVICHGKTGVEMEALVGVNAALLCVYDLVKGIDPVLALSEVHLERKEGGKSGDWIHPWYPASPAPAPERVASVFSGVRVALLTVSDRCSKGQTVDESGPALREYFEKRGASVVEAGIVPDEQVAIRGAVQSWARERDVDVIVTTGGTGVSRRDVTPEALLPLLERELPGFGERFRTLGARGNAMAWLSRAGAGQIGRTLVFMLPGSGGAVRDGLGLLDELLPHALHVVNGGDHRR